MIRRTTLIGLGLAAILSLAMFYTKYQVLAIEKQLDLVYHEIFQTEEGIHMLRAEWAYLTEPKRIQELAARHLGMVPAQTMQLVSLDRALVMQQEQDTQRMFNSNQILMTCTKASHATQ